MPIIRITLKDKQQFFISEGREGIILVDSIDKAFNYQSTLEFKVTWKLFRIMKGPYYYDVDTKFDKKNVKKFESIDQYTVEKKTFKIDEIEIKIDKEFSVDSQTFNLLKHCSITCSHWPYDKNDKWIAFPKKEDYPSITKIRYYKRGLTHTLACHKNFLRRYDDNSWHSAYEAHHKCMLNPMIQQIFLMGLDSCHEFIITEKKLY